MTLPASATGSTSRQLAACRLPGSDATTWPGPAGGATDAGGDTGPAVDAGLPACGDGECAPEESATSCPMDCHAELATTLKCVDMQCDGAWTKCAAIPPCAAAIKCIANCPDDACTKECEATAGGHLTSLDAVLNCTICRGG